MSGPDRGIQWTQTVLAHVPRPPHVPGGVESDRHREQTDPIRQEVEREDRGPQHERRDRERERGKKIPGRPNRARGFPGRHLVHPRIMACARGHWGAAGMTWSPGPTVSSPDWTGRYGP